MARWVPNIWLFDMSDWSRSPQSTIASLTLNSWYKWRGSRHCDISRIWGNGEGEVNKLILFTLNELWGCLMGVCELQPWEHKCKFHRWPCWRRIGIRCWPYWEIAEEGSEAGRSIDPGHQTPQSELWNFLPCCLIFHYAGHGHNAAMVFKDLVTKKKKKKTYSRDIVLPHNLWRRWWV